MSVKVSSWVWEHSKAKGSTRLVLLAIADIAADNGTAHHYARSISFIAKKVRLSENAVRNHIRALEDLGELRTEVGGGRGSNRYTILMTPPESVGVESDDTPPESEPLPSNPQGGTPPGSGTHPPSGLGGHHPVLIPFSPVLTPSPSLALVVDPGPAPDELFEMFWTSYPRKIDKKKAKRAFMRALKAAPVADIGAGLKRWKPYWAARDPEFTPHPTTWLNGERWNDDVPESKPSMPKAADTIQGWLAQ